MVKGKIRILIRSPNWLGDAVMALPFLENLRTFYPNSYMAIWCRPYLIDLFRAYKGVDEIVICPESLRDLLSVSFKLRKRFDMCFLLPNSFSSALFAFLSHIPDRIGYRADGRGILLTKGIKPKRDVHQIDYYLNLLSILGFKPFYCTPRLNILADGEAERERLKRRFRWGERPIVFIPGAAYGPAKCWPAEKFASLAKKIKEKDILILGSIKDRPIAKKIIGLTPNISHIFDLTGLTSLSSAMAIIKDSSIVITNDSGLMHVTAALDCPQIAIFGPTNPKRTSPYGDKTEIIYHPVPCSPCKHRVCPKDHACMKVITVEEVYERIIKVRGQYGA